MRSIFTGLFVLLITGVLWSQNAANSSFSSYGLGIRGGLGHPVMSGLGNANTTFLDSTTVNFYNPAGYSLLSKGQPLFSGAVSAELIQKSENGNESFSSIGNLQHFVIAIPIKRLFGVAAGIRPFYRKGYEITNSELVEGTPVAYHYKGKGTLNNLFLGVSSHILKYKKVQLSVGANLGYVFGTLEDIRQSGITSSETIKVGGVDINTKKVNSFHFDAGLYLNYNINQKHSLGLTFTIDPSQNLASRTEYGRYYANDVNYPNSYDTLVNTGLNRQKIRSANFLSYGLNYRLRTFATKENNKRLNSEYSFHLNTEVANYSSYNDPSDPNIQIPNTIKLAFGLQITPEINFIQNKTKTKYIERMRYRIGGYYQTLPFSIKGNQMTDVAGTFGIGFPIATQRTLSTINLGVSIGQRKTSDPTQLKETYYGINFGFTIAPGFSDRWFVKRKLD